MRKHTIFSIILFFKTFVSKSINFFLKKELLIKYFNFSKKKVCLLVEGGDTLFIYFYSLKIFLKNLLKKKKIVCLFVGHLLAKQGGHTFSF